MTSIIRIACWRIPDWSRSVTSADLAAAIVQPAALQPTDLMDMFLALPDAPRAAAARLFGFDAYIRRTEAALAAGNLPNTMALLFVGQALISMSTDTTAALHAVLQTRILRLIDVVADEQGESAPAQVTATDVDAALGR